MPNTRYWRELREREYPAAARVLLTDELLKAGESRHGGWSKAQLRLLRVYWPPARGWRRKLVGRGMSTEDYAKFLELKDAHVRPRPLRRGAPQDGLFE